MIIEQLFGSQTRWRLLSLFLKQPAEAFYVRELVRLTDSHMHALRRELAKLVDLGIISEVDGSQDMFESEAVKAKRKYYKLNATCPIIDELNALFSKDGILSKQAFIDKLETLGKVEYLLLSGTFTGADEADIDVLMVGQVPKDKLEKACAEYEKKFDKQLRYALMNEKEYAYRKDVVDRFLYQIYDHKHVIIKDAINQ